MFSKTSHKLSQWREKMEGTQKLLCPCSGSRCHCASRRPLQCSQKYRKTFCQYSVLSVPTQPPLRLNLSLYPPACWTTLLLFHVCMEQRLLLFGEVALLCAYLLLKTVVIDKNKLSVIHGVLHTRAVKQCCSRP